jgi:hypothetical protein
VPLGARTVTVSATQIFLARKALSVDHHAVTAVSVHGSRFSTDAGSQYTSIAFTDRLVEAGIDASVGSVGDAYDNALAAESQIGLYKSEPIHRHGPWRDRDHVEAATLDWVSWFNTERPTNPSTTSPRSWWKNCTTVTEPAWPRPADTKRSPTPRPAATGNNHDHLVKDHPHNAADGARSCRWSPSEEGTWECGTLHVQVAGSRANRRLTRSRSIDVGG